MIGGEQPIDIAYTVLALEKFYSVFKQEDSNQKATIAFNWFLGDNHLHQIVYNPCTGGCYDGVEEFNVKSQSRCGIYHQLFDGSYSNSKNNGYEK